MYRLPNDNLVKRSLKGDFEKKRGRGRPPKRWADVIKEDTSLPVSTSEKYVKDPIKWEGLVNTKSSN